MIKDSLKDHGRKEILTLSTLSSEVVVHSKEYAPRGHEKSELA
jgi:hypothetical protein